MDLKRCSNCKERKEFTDFHKNRSMSDGYQTWCKLCLTAAIYRDKPKKLAYIKKWQAEHPEQTHETKHKHRLRTQYALTPGQYAELLAGQGGACAICRASTPGRGRKKFCVDHDHTCCPGRTACSRCIRGLLCMNCNDGLGRFADSPALLSVATAYLCAPRRGIARRIAPAAALCVGNY